MNKSERQKLAEIIIRMKHGGGATYETTGYAEDLMDTFPSVKDIVWYLEEDAYTKKVCDILSSFLSNLLNPALVTHGRYKPAYELRVQCKGLFEDLVNDYCIDAKILAGDLFEELDEHHDSYNRGQVIHELIGSPMWKKHVLAYTGDSLKVRYLTGQLEEFSFIREMQEEGVIL